MRDSRRHTTSELTRLGPASARRPGPQQGEGFSAHLALRTRRRGGGDEQRNSLEQRKQGGAVHGFHGDVFPVLQPRSLASRRGGVEGLGEDGCRTGAVAGRLEQGMQMFDAATSGSKQWRFPRSGGAAVQLPLPLLFSFTNSGAVAPARRVPPSGGLACRPAGDMRSSGAATSALPRAAFSSFSPQLLLSPSPPLFLRWTGRKSHGAAAQYREMPAGAASCRGGA
jgi:hypothetical protein